MYSRIIDSFEREGPERKTKVIVATVSRTATISMYLAAQILGYTPYHMEEAILDSECKDLEVINEALVAQYNCFSRIQRYTKGDWENSFKQYDFIVEIPAFFGIDMLEAYADDPDVLFILVERNPDRWATSVNNSIGKDTTGLFKFTMNILTPWNKQLHVFTTFNKYWYGVWSSSTTYGAADNHAGLCRAYTEYLSTAKKILPKDRLLHLRLEDGLDWDKLCNFLDKPVPKEPFPRENDAGDFGKVIGDWVAPSMLNAALKLGSVLVLGLGVADALVWRTQGLSERRI